MTLLRNSTGTLMLVLALASACRSSGGLEQQGSRLSDVSLGHFAPAQGLPAWSAGRLVVVNKKDDKEVLTKSFGSNEKNVSAPDFKVPYGDYSIRLTYFSDSAAKTLLYKSCLNDKNEEIVYSLDQPKEVLKVEICRVKDDSNVGSTDGKSESEIEIQPVLRTSNADAGASVQAENLVSFAISSRAATASTDITVDLISLSDRAVFCHVKAMLNFKTDQGETFTLYTEAKGTESLANKGAKATVMFNVTGSEVNSGAGRNLPPELLGGSKVYGVCRATLEAAKADFERHCTKENSSQCTGLVPAS